MNRVRPGHITFVLVSAFAVASLGAATYPLLQSPPPPASTSLSAMVRPASSGTDVRILASEKASLMAVGAATEQRQAARHARLERARRKARLEAAAARRAARAARATHVAATANVSYPVSHGDYSYSGLEALWVANGGSAALEAGAACVAEAESGGNPNAFNGRDIGLWQIDPGNDPGANLYNPGVNAAEAVRLQAADGWGPWTTAPGCGL